jgi:hypothetical protein
VRRARSGFGPGTTAPAAHIAPSAPRAQTWRWRRRRAASSARAASGSTDAADGRHQGVDRHVRVAEVAAGDPDLLRAREDADGGRELDQADRAARAAAARPANESTASELPGGRWAPRVGDRLRGRTVEVPDLGRVIEADVLDRRAETHGHGGRRGLEVRPR